MCFTPKCRLTRIHNQGDEAFSKSQSRARYALRSGRIQPWAVSVLCFFAKGAIQIACRQMRSVFWQGTVLRRDSNPRHPDPKSGAIPNLATVRLLLVPLFFGGFRGDGQQIAGRTAKLRSSSTASRHHSRWHLPSPSSESESGLPDCCWRLSFLNRVPSSAVRAQCPEWL